MIRKLVPAFLALAAFLGGAAAGDMLKAPGPASAEGQDKAAEHSADQADAPGAGAAPAEAAAPAAHAPAAPPAAESAGHGGGGHGASAGSSPAWFKFPQQFFVPILHDGQLDSTMILSLSLEMPEGDRETVNAHELKLRDGLLRQLLIRANTGGFDGNFTAEPQLRALRAELLATAQGIVPAITGILIEDIARQER
ncbi:hypothetical protein [Paracoccus contaminans]|uniref:hypothetical protein n=1 Tax=Paracoccus contaminans TaxID=1945662 RepID=UPI001F0A7B4C|nr:hypothetical protein [Paracoccus contaminans]